jgi:hypothetical protein
MDNLVKKNMICFMLVFLFILLFKNSFSATYSDSVVKRNYDTAFMKLNSLLSKNGLFKEAVFIVENTSLSNKLDKAEFYDVIRDLKKLCVQWSLFNPIVNYKFSDSINVQKNFSIFSILKDTIKITLTGKVTYLQPPFVYDFNDIAGKENWSNMFVTKLFNTRKGNCHSLPYLYKILADELEATCWLSLSPNHIYIKNRCKKIGWYNTELTSGEFPIDAWITTSGYIPVKAVQTGIYMDTLSNQQAIALCVLDLAKGYEFQSKNYYDGFIIKCCDLVLQYHPVNVQAMLLKAETLKRIYEQQKTDKSTEATETYNQMEQLYMKMFDLGYREMPEKMYMQWLRSVTEQKNKYGNKQLQETLKRKTK